MYIHNTCRSEVAQTALAQHAQNICAQARAHTRNARTRMGGLYVTLS